MSQRGGREERGRGGRGRPFSGTLARQDRPQALPPLSPQMKPSTKPSLSDAFLRFPRDGEILISSVEAADDGAHDGRVRVPAADVHRCAVLDGIDSSSPPPPAEAVVQILLDRYSARVRVVEILFFRAEFYRDDESPGARAVLVMFEDSSVCAAAVAPPCSDVLASLPLDVSDADESAAMAAIQHVASTCDVCSDSEWLWAAAASPAFTSRRILAVCRALPRATVLHINVLVNSLKKSRQLDAARALFCAMMSGPALTRPDVDSMLEFVKVAISSLSWPVVLRVVVSLFDSGFFLDATDPATSEKLTLVLISALKHMLKYKLQQRACEIVDLTLTCARHLLSSEMLSTFAMGMRSANADACSFCTSIQKLYSTKDPTTSGEFCEALISTSSFGDVPGVMRLASMIRQQGVVLDRNLCLQLCVSFSRLNLIDEFLRAVSQLLALDETRSPEERLGILEQLCMCLPALRNVESLQLSSLLQDISAALDLTVPHTLSIRVLVACFANPASEVVTAVLQHALSLPSPHPVELYSAAIRCFSILADHTSLIGMFESMRSAACGMESSSVCLAVSSSVALCSASTTDAAKQHWLEYTRRLFDIAHDAGCRLTTSAVCMVFDVCSRLDSPSAELESVYKRHLLVAVPDEKFFLSYLRCRTSVSPVKIPAILHDVIFDMSLASPPIPVVVKLFNIAISSCSLAHEAAQVMQLIDAHGLTPDLYSFNSFIKVCRIDNQWRCALTQIREMQSYGISPDIVSFNSIIHAMSVAKQWMRATELFPLMEEFGVKPDVITFSSMIDACAKAQNASEGLRIFRLMQEKNVKFDYILCATMVMLCCRAFLLDEGLAVCDVLASSDLKLTFQQRCYICNLIIACFLKIEISQEKTPQLVSIFRMLSILLDCDGRDIAKDSYNDISLFLDFCNNLRQLERVLKLYPEPQPVILLQGCISILESRIPAGRSRTTSSSSVQSVQSSTSSSRATSPTPPASFENVSIAELSGTDKCVPASEQNQHNSSVPLMARVPICEVHAFDNLSVMSSSSVEPAAPFSYVFPPLKSLQPDSDKLLAREIGEICEEFQMTEADRAVRLELIRAIDVVVSKWNPVFKVAVYGSFATGLCDKDSDIDLIIATPVALSYMQSHNVYEPTTLPPPPLPPVMLDDLFILIQTDPSLKKIHERPPRYVMASVPVIKLRLKVPPSSGSGPTASISVDISSGLLPSFSMHSGILVQRFVTQSQKELPLLRPVTLFFKKLLRCCSLNDPFSGGFGSYSTVLLVRAYLMLSNAQTRSLSPAAAVAEMCSWVADFDWRQQQVVWASGSPVVDRMGAAIEASIWLGDPVNGNGNVARASFQFGDVIRLCRNAARLLTNYSELEARAGILKEKDARMFAYKRAVKGEKGSRSSVGLIACLAAD